MSDFDLQGLVQVSLSTDIPAHRRIVDGAISEITTLRQQLADAKEENEQVRQANIHTMDVFEDMKAAKEKAEARVAELERDRLKLPHDIVINGGMTFRKGVSLKTFISAAERWHRQAMSQHDHVDKEGLRLLFRGAERAGGEK